MENINPSDWEIYDSYVQYCNHLDIEPASFETADFAVVRSAAMVNINDACGQGGCCPTPRPLDATVQHISVFSEGALGPFALVYDPSRVFV
jgi:hypothetical protein